MKPINSGEAPFTNAWDTRPSSARPSLFRCPACRLALPESPSPGSCASCGHRWPLIGGEIDDFLGDHCSSIGKLLGWPDAFVESVGSLLEAGASGLGLDDPGRESLESRGLARGGASAGDPMVLTRLGHNIRYQMREELWQSGDEEFGSFLDQAGVGPDSTILDVGCGAGQTMRLMVELMADQSPAVLVGIDGDAEGLALGRLIADRSGIPITFARADAHDLPVPDASFSMVVCRVALNYMHQARALAEMARVVKPGGFLYLRVERVHYDLRLIVRSKGIRQGLCRARDLGIGLALAATGSQPTPGRGARCGRSFATRRRMGRVLNGLGLEIVRSEGSQRCPTLFGASTQTTLLARKGLP